MSICRTTIFQSLWIYMTNAPEIPGYLPLVSISRLRLAISRGQDKSTRADSFEQEAVSGRPTLINFTSTKRMAQKGGDTSKPQ